MSIRQNQSVFITLIKEDSLELRLKGVYIYACPVLLRSANHAKFISMKAAKAIMAMRVMRERTATDGTSMTS